MTPSLPNAKSARSPGERAKLKRVVAARGLCGLANDTKWNEFVEAMRAHQTWRPSYRYKSVAGFISEWDAEWFYHLPFPFIGVEWFDLYYTQKKRMPSALAPELTDHSAWIEDLLKKVGLEYQKGPTMIRIFGYSPRDQERFEA